MTEVGRVTAQDLCTHSSHFYTEQISQNPGNKIGVREREKKNLGGTQAGNLKRIC